MLFGEHLLDSTSPGKSVGSLGPIQKGIPDPGFPGFLFAGQKKKRPPFLGPGPELVQANRAWTDHLSHPLQTWKNLPSARR
eukprot:1544099-Pyramimonas_sp.AAC.1